MSLVKLFHSARDALFGDRNRAYTPVTGQRVHRHASLDSTGSTSSDDTVTLEKRALYRPAPTSTASKWITPRVVSDATIGLSDGLTVPFALTAGLSALGDPKVVIYGGMAELFAGAISMGVGGYLGARSECQAYQASVVQAHQDSQDPDLAAQQVHTSLSSYGLSIATMNSISDELSCTPEALRAFLLRFYHEQTDENSSSLRAYLSGLVIATGYFLGGLLPLLPYLFCADMGVAFWWSCGIMANVLFGFGCVKTALVGGATTRMACFWNGVQMLLLGGAAAAAAMGCVKAIGGGHG